MVHRNSQITLKFTNKQTKPKPYQTNKQNLPTTHPQFTEDADRVATELKGRGQFLTFGLKKKYKLHSVICVQFNSGLA